MELKAERIDQKDGAEVGRERFGCQAGKGAAGQLRVCVKLRERRCGGSRFKGVRFGYIKDHFDPMRLVGDGPPDLGVGVFSGAIGVKLCVSSGICGPALFLLLVADLDELAESATLPGDLGVGSVLAVVLDDGLGQPGAEAFCHCVGCTGRISPHLSASHPPHYERVVYCAEWRWKSFQSGTTRPTKPRG
jgi:hypothetical protein